MTVPHRTFPSRPAGTAFARYSMQKAIQEKYGTKPALDQAAALTSTPTVYATLEAELQTKAAVAAGTTSDATFAGPLATYGIAQEALQLIRGASIIGALEGKMRRAPFRTKVSRETGAGTGGAWVGENLATPIAATAYDAIQQEAYKAGKIVVLSDELRKVGDPGRRAHRQRYRGRRRHGVSRRPIPHAHRYALGRVTACGHYEWGDGDHVDGLDGGADQADLNSMLAAITTTGASLVWIWAAADFCTYRSDAWRNAATGLPSNLFGIPVIASANSPQQITLIDAARILYSDDGAIDIATSTQALLELNDAPAEPTAASTVMTSLYQRNLWAVRVLRWLAYLRAQSGAVAYMTVAY